MSLRDIAREDLRSIMDDDCTAFGSPITIENPNGDTINIVGRWAETAAQEDPDTGVLVVSSLAHVSCHLSNFRDAGFEIPESVDEVDQKPWLVIAEGKTFRISEPLVDEMLDTAVFYLEDYKR